MSDSNSEKEPDPHHFGFGELQPGSGSSDGGDVVDRSWVSRNLIVLCGVSFFQDAASELLYPILPIFLTVTLGAPVTVVGLVEGFAEGAASITKLAAGNLSDRYSKKPLIGVGYGLAAIGKIIIAASYAWPFVLTGRAVDRLGKGVRGAPRDALIVTGIPENTRGRAFGLHRAMDTAGAVVGPLIGLAAYEGLHHQIRPLLLVAIVPSVVSVFLVALVRDHSRVKSPADRPKLIAKTSGAPLPRVFWRTVIFLIAFSLINFPDALLLLRVSQVSHSLPFVVLAYAGYNAVYALLSYPAGALADRLGAPRVFALGLVCFASCYLGLGLTHSREAIWPLLAIYGGFTAATDGVGKSWVSGLVPSAMQGHAQGLYQGLTGGAVLIAGLWAGLAWNGSGQLPLILSGSVALLLALIVALPAVRREFFHQAVG